MLLLCGLCSAALVGFVFTLHSPRLGFCFWCFTLCFCCWGFSWFVTFGSDGLPPFHCVGKWQFIVFPSPNWWELCNYSITLNHNFPWMTQSFWIFKNGHFSFKSLRSFSLFSVIYLKTRRKPIIIFNKWIFIFIN